MSTPAKIDEMPLVKHTNYEYLIEKFQITSYGHTRPDIRIAIGRIAIRAHTRVTTFKIHAQNMSESV
jgi:hypothetical protein